MYSPIFSEVAPFYPFPFVHPLSDPTVPLKGKLTDPRNLILETRFSILDSRKLWGSRLESSFETFEAVREFIETVREFIESSFETFEWKKQRTFCAINFWHVLNLSFIRRSILNSGLWYFSPNCFSENLLRSFSFFNLFYWNLSWMSKSFTKYRKHSCISRTRV